MLGYATQVSERATVKQSIPLGSASLWAPEHPTLYTLTTTLQPLTADGAAAGAADEVSTLFGVRTIRFDADHGFFLNGVPTKIRGCANHQDVAGLGVAVPDPLQEYRIKALQNFGVNGWRTAHNAPNEALLHAADKLGMLVWDEWPARTECGTGPQHCPRPAASRAELPALARGAQEPSERPAARGGA
jgi:beta-galactosidase